MRKLSLLLLILPLALMAQVRFGYFSYSKVLEATPQYKKATDEYNSLKTRCEKEIEHNEQELTRYYVAFLDGQHDFPEPILRKRQNELQQMIDNCVLFREQVNAWLSEAKDSLYQPCHRAVENALSRVCGMLSLGYAIDTDLGVYKYINPDMGLDITGFLIEAIINPAPTKSVTEDNVDINDGQPAENVKEDDVISDEESKEESGKEAITDEAKKNDE